jgi:hypothetical protein
MQQARISFTCVLYGWKGLLYRIRNLFFKAPKTLSTVTLSEECLRLNSSLALVGRFMLLYSDKWYLTPPVGRQEAIAASIPCVYQVVFTYKCTSSA